MSNSAILFQNAQRTTFLVDIPTSIELAQDMRPNESPGVVRHEIKRGSKISRNLISAPPLQAPYPFPPEPKTDAARARVLEHITLSDRLLHDNHVTPLVREGLREIKETYGRHIRPGDAEGVFPWCLPRVLAVMRDTKDSSHKLHHDSIFNSTDQPDQLNGRKRKRPGTADDPHAAPDISSRACTSRADADPPLILAPDVNDFGDLTELRNVTVKNPSPIPASIRVHSVSGPSHQAEEVSLVDQRPATTFTVPPLSSFVLCTLPITEKHSERLPSPAIPGLPADRSFNLILLDPPWPNRSARRSAHYTTYQAIDMNALTNIIRNILVQNLHTAPWSPGNPDGEHGNKKKMPSTERRSQQSIAAIWVTNSGKSKMAAYDTLSAAGLCDFEEWIWAKTTIAGELVSPLDGLWKKPYEILVVGRKKTSIGPKHCGQAHSQGVGTTKEAKIRRLIVAVPDIHSRKPNLREVFEAVFFSHAASDLLPSGNSEIGLESSAATSIGTNSISDSVYDEISGGRNCRYGTHIDDYSALEVFARNLTAGWCACGDEVLKFNCESMWSVSKEEAAPIRDRIHLADIRKADPF